MLPANLAHHRLAIDRPVHRGLAEGRLFGARYDSLPISSAPLSGACDTLRRAGLGRVEARSLYRPAPQQSHHFNHRKASMLIRTRATTDTPGALVEGLTEAKHDAIVEAHAPHEGRILRMR